MIISACLARVVATSNLRVIIRGTLGLWAGRDNDILVVEQIPEFILCVSFGRSHGDNSFSGSREDRI